MYDTFLGTQSNRIRVKFPLSKLQYTKFHKIKGVYRAGTEFWNSQALGQCENSQALGQCENPFKSVEQVPRVECPLYGASGTALSARYAV